ncbi:NAD(P)/FAD-dependent oxidoreductase [Chitinophaga sp. sic0106]|uniref:NAD(P)/FAD-dependent oxidoreductase n=1 Tax=Chitinophaga sp. sic0106 TaxID=2854785 RepID=UPI001C437B84|nr:NAD(P)/FAD-dependent oxidoreductase [Chitinophaga sp. sic0106]MBV7534002.1 NAD(P)/FAD-dependent oxidoreductase [Chitinophaga sp. sic0106]
MQQIHYDAIIIGGSYAGLSAAMALARSKKTVLLIDGGQPANRFTPHSHNVITLDGAKPGDINATAKKQVMAYPTVTFVTDIATIAARTPHGFNISTKNNLQYQGKKLVLATGWKDEMPDIPGFADCWGISILHCPYCHGYEVKDQPTGIIASGEPGYDFVKLISNWTSQLTVFSNGLHHFTEEQLAKLQQHHIPVITTAIKAMIHEEGQLKKIILADGTSYAITALYARPAMLQQSEIPQQLALDITEQGTIKTDMMQRTSAPGVYACGDITSMGRSVANAMATGSVAGAMLNKELIADAW